jgi:hypothetical protein
MNQRPPFLLHLVAAAFLVAASIQAFGTIELVRSWNWLQMTGYSPSPLVVVFKNAFLTLAFLLSAIFLWTRLPLAPGFSAAALLLGTAWFWVNRIVLTSNPLPFKNHLFLILADLVLVLLAIASLYLLVPYMKTPPEDKEVENE